MKTVGAYEAKTKLSALLDLVAEGETVTIPRHGVAVALLMPVADTRQITPIEAAERIRKTRRARSLKGLSLSEMREDGRRY